MLHIKLSINQTGNGDPPPKKPVNPRREQVPTEQDPVDSPTQPAEPK